MPVATSPPTPTGTPTTPTVPTTPPGPEPLPPGDGHNLGIAAFPEGVSKFDATMYGWRARTLAPKDYRMGYALLGTEQQAIRTSHHAYARKVGHETSDGEVFRWLPPPGCGGSLACVFAELVKRNRQSVQPISERFSRRVSEGNLDAMEAATLVVSWVQAIRYEIPRKEPFGVLPPALVAAESWGDCDSKALLALMVLHDLGIESILISSTSHRHTMLGVPVVASGTHFTYAGRRYAFTECTAVGAPIGYLDAKLKNPNDWQAVTVKM